MQNSDDKLEETPHKSPLQTPVQSPNKTQMTPMLDPQIAFTPQKTPPPKPKKQGLIYSLDLGQNNGPFLLKDINYSNKKSVRLLLNSNESKKVANQAMNVLEGICPSNLDMNKADKLFEDWESLLEAKLGLKKNRIFNLTDPSKEEIDVASIKEKDDEKEKLDFSNIDERYKTKLSNIENLTNELKFDLVF